MVVLLGVFLLVEGVHEARSQRRSIAFSPLTASYNCATRFAGMTT